MVDVVLVVAADGEDDAVRTVNAGSLGTWTPMQQSKLPRGYQLEAWECKFLTAEKKPLTIVLSRAPAQRTESTTKIATELVRHFEPICLAMCGVCGGRPNWTRLGDVVIASLLYKFGAGRNTSRTSSDGTSQRRHAPVIVTYNLDGAWRQAAERFQVEGDWLATRPIERERQADWLIHELGQGRNPRNSPDRKRRCADWSAVLASLRDQDLLEGDSIALTEAGRIRAQRIDDDNPDGIPEPSHTPINVIVAPFGTSDNLEARAGIWEDLEHNQSGVAALDMEAWAIGLVAQECRIPIAIVGKGVMDFADEKREYGYRDFAARASAEVIIGLIRKQIDKNEGFTKRVAQRETATTLSPAARSLLARVHDLLIAGKEYSVPADFVRESKAISAEEAALHKALRELRTARCIDGDGRWLPGKAVTLTDGGRHIAQYLASLADTSLVAGGRARDVASVSATMTIVVETMAPFSLADLVNRVRDMRSHLTMPLFNRPEVLTEGLRWGSADGRTLEVGLNGRIAYKADASAAAHLRKDEPNGDWGDEAMPGVSVLALLKGALSLARFAVELCKPGTSLSIAVSLEGVKGKVLSFDEMDRALRPIERVWHYTFWNHDSQPCRVTSIKSSPHSLMGTTRQDACLGVFEDIAAFFLFNTGQSMAHPRTIMRKLLEEVDAL